MASSTVHQFNIELAHVDRGVYESMSVKVARHPSETADFLWARVLAFCLEYRDGIAFAGDISSPDDPAIAVRGATGDVLTWIEVGLPDPVRLNRATRAAERVAVYAHREPRQWLRRLAGERLRGAGTLALFALSPGMLAQLGGDLERRNSVDVSVCEGQICVVQGAQTRVGEITMLDLLSPG